MCRAACFVRFLFACILFFPLNFVWIENSEAQSCTEWVSRAVSVQGVVESRKSGEKGWTPVRPNESFCPGDMIRVSENSRAALVLPNDTVIRLDQRTALTFHKLEEDKTSYLEALRGALYFFAPVPKKLEIVTPFVNATVEGTEFLLKVGDASTEVTVFQGRVRAANRFGTVLLANGEGGIAVEGQPPKPVVLVEPRNAVQWVLYYPPIFPWEEDTADWSGREALLRSSIEFYRQGDVPRALSLLEGVRDEGDARFFVYRAGLLLHVGQVSGAVENLQEAMKVDPANGLAHSLLSIIAVVQNQPQRALESARQATSLSPRSSTAFIALSYALQASFDLEGALSSAREAVNRDPGNAYAWARLAELLLSFGYVGDAREAAGEAVKLDSRLSHSHAILGFARLADIKVGDAKQFFEKAILLDQAAPLPRLGLGLARIREGDLEGGRRDIEIAVSLDPDRALIRSYLGKAYFDEKRNSQAMKELETAKSLDPMDPTPWLYDAVRKVTENRPVEALHDFQKSIELNDNRAVYRSRFLLDSDLAARSAGMARIYRDLGFEQLALVEGWKSSTLNPGNYSAHRFLADTYSTLPRHEIARVSELLQSQLLQPINITPVSPHLAEGELFILEGAGPTDLAFNEFNPLFSRNRVGFQGSGVLGNNSTFGEELVLSVVEGPISFSMGQFHYRTDGFRANNDQKRDILNAFAQTSLSYKTSVQAEVRRSEYEIGHLPILFDAGNFTPLRRENNETETARFGMRHSFTPQSDFIASFIYRNVDRTNENVIIGPDLDIASKEKGYLAEAQHIHRFGRVTSIAGIGYSDLSRDDTQTFTPPGFPPGFSITSINEAETDHTNLYLYSHIRFPEKISWTFGLSYDHFKGGLLDLNEKQINPKFGFLWNVQENTVLRGAAFRTFKRPLISSQTLEPTHVAGFNQFFDDTEGTESWRYGLGLDRKISPNWYGGLEYSERKLDVPYLRVDLLPGQPPVIRTELTDWEERFGRAYLYWTPHPRVSAGVEYQFEDFWREPTGMTGEERFEEMKTHRVPVSLRLFHPSGLRFGATGTYVRQKGIFEKRNGFVSFMEEDSDSFWVLDAHIGYRLPKRHGIISVEAKNLLDKGFNFQDMDPANPRIARERLVLAKFTLAF